jgi:uncharacterized protein
MNVPSPCTGICKLDGDDICIGCFRSKDEIAYWTQMSDPEKLSVIVTIDEYRKILAVTNRN